MKKRIFTAAIILVVSVALGFLTMMVIDRYKQKLNNTPAPVAMISVTEANKTVANVKKSADDRYQQLRDLYATQTTECTKGRIAYDKLTATLKVQTPISTCQPSLTD